MCRLAGLATAGVGVGAARTISDGVADFAYASFVVGALAQKIVGWNATTSKPSELVMDPLRMAFWSRDQQEHRS